MLIARKGNAQIYHTVSSHCELNLYQSAEEMSFTYMSMIELKSQEASSGDHGDEDVMNKSIYVTVLYLSVAMETKSCHRNI